MSRARDLEMRAEQVGGALQALRMHGDAARAMAKAMLAASGLCSSADLAKVEHFGPPSAALSMAATLAENWAAEVRRYLATPEATLPVLPEPDR